MSRADYNSVDGCCTREYAVLDVTTNRAVVYIHSTRETDPTLKGQV